MPAAAASIAWASDGPSISRTSPRARPALRNADPHRGPLAPPTVATSVSPHSLRSGPGRRLSPCPVSAAADAAEEGAKATIPLQARKGRASYLGERSVGHQDPGATSTALVMRALERAVSEEG